MRRLLLLILCLSWLSQTAFGQITESHRKAAMDLMDASQIQSMMSQISEQMSTAFSGSFGAEKLSPAEQAVFDEHMREVFDLTFSQLMSDEALVRIAEIYAGSFTEEELREITEFYRSPIGQKMIEKMPAMTSESMQMSIQLLDEIRPEIETLSEQFQLDMKAARESSE